MLMMVVFWISMFVLLFWMIVGILLVLVNELLCMMFDFVVMFMVVLLFIVFDRCVLLMVW